MKQLNERKERVLHAVVIEYILEAEPISSELIANKYELGVRSATIRNELAEMEDLGYLTQPHTSAGRIPSDQGYRYYVDCLMNLNQISRSTRTKVKSFTQEGNILLNLIQETTKFLSKMTSLMSCAIILQNTHVYVRNFILHHIGQQKILLNLVLSNGHVENRFLEAPPKLTTEILQKINHYFSTQLETKNLAFVSKWAESPTNLNFIEPEINVFMSNLSSVITHIVKELIRGQLIVEGEEFMLSQPEFQKNILYEQDLLHSLSDQDLLYNALVAGDEQKETITIGKENSSKHLHSFSLIKQPIYTHHNETGVIALVGPTRLNYERSIPLLNYAAESISYTLTHYFSAQH